MDKISPSDWLDEHQPVGDFGALEAGRMVLASHSGNVWVALYLEPELRLEVVLAWLDQAGDVETVKNRVQQLSDFTSAADEVRVE